MQLDALKTVHRTVFACRTDIGTGFRILFLMGVPKGKSSLWLLFPFGPPDRIRTYGTRNRNPVLYPAELRAVIYPMSIAQLL